MHVSDLADELGLSTVTVVAMCEVLGIEARWAGAELSDADAERVRADEPPLDATPPSSGLIAPGIAAWVDPTPPLPSDDRPSPVSPGGSPPAVRPPSFGLPVPAGSHLGPDGPPDDGSSIPAGPAGSSASLVPPPFGAVAPGSLQARGAAPGPPPAGPPAPWGAQPVVTPADATSHPTTGAALPAWARPPDDPTTPASFGSIAAGPDASAGGDADEVSAARLAAVGAGSGGVGMRATTATDTGPIRSGLPGHRDAMVASGWSYWARSFGVLVATVVVVIFVALVLGDVAVIGAAYSQHAAASRGKVALVVFLFLCGLAWVAVLQVRGAISALDAWNRIGHSHGSVRGRGSITFLVLSAVLCCTNLAWFVVGGIWAVAAT